ncbi:hypothetical protein BCR35DRAFT_356414 [Leucosporidium creatinivorum]|uniref:Uncharacterized protein n=1 Tax=Leucosporidium creatinivorum TaxID=106004 RepID=A0A1Y2C4K8_9BASI|nr:hypothetical protein BCR35DRAFT_356414 [Leucosporidium creatinivorum]
MPSNSEGGLQRSQRALSQAALSSSFTPLTSQYNDAGPASSATRRTGRARSSSTSDALAGLSDAAGGQGDASWPFDSTFTTRGFDAATDPFAALQLDSNEKFRFGGSKTVSKESKLSDEDGWWERLGARASRFGGWTEGEGRRWGCGENERGCAGYGRDGDVEDEEERFVPARLGTGAQSSRRMPAGSAERTKLALAVWHDQFEEGEDPHSDYDYFQPSSHSSSPFSTPSLSFTSLSMSNPSSPTSSRSLPLHSPPPSSPRGPQESKKFTSPGDQDLDDLAHSFLATQDRWGVFGLVEQFIEWPWSTPTNATPPSFSVTETPRSGPITPGSSLPPSSPISRAASSHSLALDMFAPVQLDEGAWTEYGELSAYSRARLASGVGSTAGWEGGERLMSSGDGDGVDGVRRKRQGAVREGLGALMDVVGVGSFV